MNLLERVGLAALHCLDPERSHGLALAAMRAGLTPRLPAPTSARLATDIAGLHLPNPVGLAAGFDKNATAIDAIQGSGFGFAEVGAVTPRPQPGNPRPRLFRLSQDRAAINRFGFNNDGAAAVAERLARRDRNKGVLGINLGANKDSDDKAADFAEVLRVTGAHVDFATVNVSSPNTERLRDLQGKAALAALLAQVLETNAGLARPVPVFLKVAPDLEESQIDEIAEVALASGISGLFATNTTLDRDGLHGPHAGEAGGLSGQPLMEKSTRVLAAFAHRIGDRLPLVGIGGISSAEDALRKIRAGASAVQLYTALVFEGISLAPRIARDLDRLLAQEGFDSAADAVGTGIADELPT